MSTTWIASSAPASDALGNLVRAAAAGNEDAWRALVERYDRTVYASARRVRGLTAEDYDDAVAMTWLHFVDDIHRLRQPAAAPGWLRTTAYREALKLAGTRPRTVSVEDELGPGGIWVEPDLAEDLACDQIRRTMIAAMDDLSPTGRRLLAALLDDPDASYKDIEARHGIGVSSIGPIRRRVLKTLEVALEGIGVAVPSAPST